MTPSKIEPTTCRLVAKCLNHLRHRVSVLSRVFIVNPLNPELNPICYLLALLAHHFLHVSRIRVNQLLYCVSLKIYNKFANYFCELKFSGNTHQRP